jgi:hypothetical protein
MTAFGTGLPLRDVSFDGEFRRVTGPSSGIGKFLELPIEHSEPAADVERVHQAGWWYQEFACDRRLIEPHRARKIVPLCYLPAFI